MNQEQYRASCTHYRKGHQVFTVDGTLEFDERPVNAIAEKATFMQTKMKGRSNVIGQYYNNHGINKAKRYVRKNGLVSFNKD